MISISLGRELEFVFFNIVLKKIIKYIYVKIY